MEKFIMYKPVVVQLINGLKAGGSEIFGIDMACQLKNKGIKSHVINVFNFNDEIKTLLENKLEEADIPYYCLNKPPFKKDFKSAVRYLSILKKINPTIVHSHCATPNWINGVLTRIYSKNIRRVATLHSVNDRHTSWSIVDKITGRQQFHSVVCVSKAVYDTTLKEKNKKIILVGRDLEKFLNNINTNNMNYIKNSIQKESIVFINVGRMFDEAKNQSALIKAFAQLPKKMKAHLILVGDGDKRKDLEELAINSGAYNNIQFLGNVADINKIYSIADVFIMPSLCEGRPIAAMEAFVSGLLCIFSTINPLIELSKGISGVRFCDGTDINSIRKMMEEVCEWLGHSRWRRPKAEREKLRWEMGIEKCADEHLKNDVYGIES